MLINSGFPPLYLCFIIVFQPRTRKVESYFSFSELLTHWDTPLAPEPANGILDIWQKLVKDKMSYQSQLSQISACNTQSRKEDKISL